jgi:hypothetical protein
MEMLFGRRRDQPDELLSPPGQPESRKSGEIAMRDHRQTRLLNFHATGMILRIFQPGSRTKVTFRRYAAIVSVDIDTTHRSNTLGLEPVGMHGSPAITFVGPCVFSTIRRARRMIPRGRRWSPAHTASQTPSHPTELC